MHRFARIFLALSCLGMILVIPASADARTPYLVGTGNFTLDDSYCYFPVQVSYTANEYVIHQSTAPDGTVTQQITGNAVYTVTNATSGKSITYQANGPGTVVTYPDGAFSLDLHGPNLLWTTRVDSYPGVPYVSYTKGHLTVSVDASGTTTAYGLHGTQTDVCQALAG
ncbi:MAG: hypothetical protein ACXVII_32225 [Solirubrobacteraceae bacterium]